MQLVTQGLRLFQIARIEPFSEPPVHWSQQFARLPHLALVAPEACEAHGSAEFPEFCKRTRSSALRAGDNQRSDCINEGSGFMRFAQTNIRLDAAAPTVEVPS
jgi:hypothetical protein